MNKKTCPVCSTRLDEFSEYCTLPGCGWHFFNLLSDSSAEIDAYNKILTEAKDRFVEQNQLKSLPEIAQDPFETDEEYAQRLSNQFWYAGTATLFKKLYNIDTGTFPLTIKWEQWIKNPRISRLSGKQQIIVSRDFAREVYEFSPEWPVCVVLKITGKKIEIYRILLMTCLGKVEIRNHERDSYEKQRKLLQRVNRKERNKTSIPYYAQIRSKINHKSTTNPYIIFIALPSILLATMLPIYIGLSFINSLLLSVSFGFAVLIGTKKELKGRGFFNYFSCIAFNSIFYLTGFLIFFAILSEYDYFYILFFFLACIEILARLLKKKLKQYD